MKHTRPLSLDARIPGSESEETHRETLVAAGPDGYEATRGNEVQRAFETALAEVDAEDREVLVLRDVEDLSYESIAEVLDVAIGTVRSRLHRARTALRRRMAPVLDR